MNFKVTKMNMEQILDVYQYALHNNLATPSYSAVVPEWLEFSKAVYTWAKGFEIKAWIRRNGLQRLHLPRGLMDMVRESDILQPILEKYASESGAVKYINSLRGNQGS
jgi:hypothetical protein